MFALLYAVQPLLPQLADSFELEPGSASLALSAATIAVAVGVVPLAALSELIGRRRVMLGSVILAVLLAVGCAFAPNFPALLVLRVLLGLAIAGLPATAMAYLAEELDGTSRGVALGALVAGNSMGGMCGRLVAGISYDWLGWRGALGLSTALAVLGALVFACALPSSRGSSGSAAEQRPTARAILSGLGLAVRAPLLLAQYAVAFLAMGAFVAAYNAAGFRLTSEPLALAPAIAALVFLAYAAGWVSSPLAGRLAERHGRTPVLLSALGVTVLGAMLTIPDVVWLIALGLLVFTGGFFAAHAAASGWVGAAAPESARGQASGLYQCAYYAGASIGGSVGSAIYGGFGWTALTLVGTGWLVLAGVGVLLGMRGRERSTRSGATPQTVPSVRR
ncbi:YNFM family putative membrane transporter [Tamaricihabitans halophyticus]|uniref:YNFM family putative membrane transporter n=1 Tax=Tamaricihabitans halophyticus TaxID=1262583 RepID=A0A4R2R0P8_9PSEU|nr:YNFM family putative membrane transporter [Tamaricihabitans halophyticus]